MSDKHKISKYKYINRIFLVVVNNGQILFQLWWFVRFASFDTWDDLNKYLTGKY